MKNNLKFNNSNFNSMKLPTFVKNVDVIKKFNDTVEKYKNMDWYELNECIWSDNKEHFMIKWKYNKYINTKLPSTLQKTDNNDDRTNKLPSEFIIKDWEWNWNFYKKIESFVLSENWEVRAAVATYWKPRGDKDVNTFFVVKNGADSKHKFKAILQNNIIISQKNWKIFYRWLYWANVSYTKVSPNYTYKNEYIEQEKYYLIFDDIKISDDFWWGFWLWTFEEEWFILGDLDIAKKIKIIISKKWGIIAYDIPWGPADNSINNLIGMKLKFKKKLTDKEWIENAIDLWNWYIWVNWKKFLKSVLFN